MPRSDAPASAPRAVFHQRAALRNALALFPARRNGRNSSAAAPGGTQGPRGSISRKNRPNAHPFARRILRLTRPPPRSSLACAPSREDWVMKGRHTARLSTNCGRALRLNISTIRGCRSGRLRGCWAMRDRPRSIMLSSAGLDGRLPLIGTAGARTRSLGVKRQSFGPTADELALEVRPRPSSRLASPGEERV
jgi:hypothetical protein